jgi:hypothetical protein
MKVFIDNVIVDGEVKGKLYLESDEMQFVLKEYNGKVTVNAKGKEVEQYKTHGYYTNVHFALKHFLKMKIMGSTATTLRELQEDIESIRRYIESVLPLGLPQEAHRAPTEV